MLKNTTTLFLILIFTATAAFAQKQKLEIEDYGQWQRITSTDFSPDGSWFAYNISLVDGDGWLILKKVGTDSTGEHKFMHGVRTEFSENGKWVAFLIGVSEDKEEKLEEQKKQVKYKLALMNLATAAVDTFTHVRDFTFSEKGNYLVMEKYQAENAETEGSDIILRDLETCTNQLIGNVADYSFNDAGTMLAVLIDANEQLGNGVHLYQLSENTIEVLESDTTDYTHLLWHGKKSALAFLKERTDENYEDETYFVYAFKNLDEDGEKFVFDQRDYEAFPDSTRVVDYRSLQWAKDGQTLFFGIKKWEKKEDKDESKKNAADSTAADSTAADSVKIASAQNKMDEEDDLEPSNVEVWHWEDARIQPRQELVYKQDLKENYLAAWHLDAEKFVQIGSEKYEGLDLTNNEEHAVAYDATPYEPSFEESWQVIYLIDIENGKTTQVLEKHEYVLGSPGGNYLYYFKQNDWWTYNISRGEHVNLTEDIDTRFQNYHSVTGRQYDRQFGSGQWSENDEWLLLYGEYDVYRVSSDGEDVERLTHGADENIRYRQDRLNYEIDYLKEDQPIYFTMYGDSTKHHGYARYSDGELETLMYEPALFTRLNKAEKTNAFVYMEQAAANSPDFFYISDSFDNAIALTHTNPQQEEYYWADDELITFTNVDGDRLQGRLIYPANYQPGKKYPMITYIYEERSQSMHRYSYPSKKSPYNFRRFSSEGFFVFQPDITYDLRDPGMSAVGSVVPAVKKVISTGMINEEQIGLTGHSWGAYQTTFIITQTDLFNSAVAGAPLTNMISMYNSIYWNSGTPDAMIFEVSQGRFPEPWWKDWDNFVQNSPIFQMQGVSTPLLVEFGTQDGAVDFNQGVELYITMRRMQNPFVMLVYEGENHGLAREENRIDYATRAFQWHAYYLLDEEPADWITEGLPYIKRPAITEDQD